MVNFGERLKELRIQAGLTQQQLANQIGTSKSVISFYENSERSCSPAVLIQLASVFHVSADYLLGIDNTERLDLTGLDEDDKKLASLLVDTLRKKNKQ